MILVTKHFNRRFMSSYLDGHVRFGTLVQYRNTEDQVLDALIPRVPGGPTSPTRHGPSDDPLESLDLEIYDSEDGFLEEFQIDGQTLGRGLFAWGCRNFLVIDETFNNHVSCFSLGGFKKSRAERLKAEAGYDAFVVYDFAKLYAAISQSAWMLHVQNHSSTSDPETLVKPISYNRSIDRKMLGPRAILNSTTMDSDTLAERIFSKPSHFSHEEEIRFVLLTAPLGALPPDAGSLSWEDWRVRSSVPSLTLATGFP